MRYISDKTLPAPIFRGHHLICLHFYNGEGYNADYIEHLSNILIMAEKGAIEICEGADCICTKCPNLCENNCAYYENAETDIRRMDAAALELLKLTPGMSISWMEVRQKVERIFQDWNRMYCKDCNWISACEKSAGFRNLISE